MFRPIVVALEGIPGAGKTTVTDLLSFALKLKGFHPIVVGELGEGYLPVGLVRSLKRIIRGMEIRDRFRTLLLMAIQVRKRDIEEELRQSEEYDIILLDRALWTVLVDAHTEEIPTKTVDWLMDNIPSVQPHLTILLRVSPQKARAERKPGSRILANEALTRKIVDSYERFARRYRWKVVDADTDIRVVLEQCLALIEEFLSTNADCLAPTTL